MTQTSTLIDLIRHGEPVGGRRYRGNGADHPLSALGWEQMWAAIGSEHPWDQVIASPLVRCRAFALALVNASGAPLAIDWNLREIGMGTWEGRSPAEVEASDPEGFAAYYRDPVQNRPPGGESLAALSERVGHAYERAVVGNPDRHLLLVVHAGVMRAIVGRLLLADPRRWYRIRIDYASVVRVRYDRFGPRLECINAPRVPARG